MHAIYTGQKKDNIKHDNNRRPKNVFFIGFNFFQAGRHYASCLSETNQLKFNRQSPKLEKRHGQRLKLFQILRLSTRPRIFSLFLNSKSSMR